jgi:hypothetical protein
MSRFHPTRLVLVAPAATLLVVSETAEAEHSATNVFRLDRTTGALEQVNLNATGGQAVVESDGIEASVSADGRYVEFRSPQRRAHANP